MAEENFDNVRHSTARVYRNMMLSGHSKFLFREGNEDF